MRRIIPKYNFAGIYQIINLVNGKKYIGQAQNIYRRIRAHRRSRNGVSFPLESILYKAIKKYGWNNFEISVLEKINDHKLLDEKEIFWINIFKANDKKFGYNIRAGGKIARGWYHSEETKRKISEARMGKYSGTENPFYGKHHTKEATGKISLANFGRKWTEREREKFKNLDRHSKLCHEIFQIDPYSGQIIKQWKSVSFASRSLNICMSTILCVANQTPYKKKEKIYIRKTAGGYRWQYV